MESGVVQEEACRFRASTENFIVIVTFAIIFILSVLGNALVILVIVKQRAMRSITNIYLMNLAVSDLMLSVVCLPPTLVSMVMNCWMFGSIGCKVLAFLQPMAVTASAYTLAVIAFERYFAICKPLHSRIWQTRSHAYAMITIVWAIAIIANVTMLFMYEQRVYEGIGCAPVYEPVYHFAYQVYMTVVLLVVPLVVMTVLYGSVIHTLKSGIKMEIATVVVDAVTSAANPDNTSQYCALQHLIPFSHSTDNLRCLGDDLGALGLPRAVSHMALLHPNMCAVPSCSIPGDAEDNIWSKLQQKLNLPGMDKSISTMSHRKSEASVCADNSLRSTHNQKNAMAKQRVIKMLIVVVIIFFCCWTPSYIWWLLIMAGDSFQRLQLNIWNADLNTFITLLTYMSSCANPITYCFLNKKFRNAIYAMFGKQKTLKHHFQKCYMPVNRMNGFEEDVERRLIHRSASSTCNPQTLSARPDFESAAKRRRMKFSKKYNSVDSKANF